MKLNPLKIFLISGAVAPLACVLTSCSNTEKTAHLVAINDLHATVESYHNNYAYESQIGCLADNYENIRKQYPNSTKFISMGDNCDGSAICKFENEQPVYDLLSYFGLEYSVLGNHELYSPQNQHLDPTKEDSFVKWGKLKAFLACNAYKYDGTEHKWKYCDYFKPYAIQKVGDLNIGIVGYTREKNPKDAPAAGDIACANAISDDKFPDINKTGAEILQEAIDACHEDKLNLNNGVKPDVVILAMHRGVEWPKEGKYDKNVGTFKIISKIKGVAASIEGDSHLRYNLTTTDKEGKTIPLAQTSGYASAINHLTFKYKKNNKSDCKCSFELIDTKLTTKKGELSNKNADWIVNLRDRLYDWYLLNYDETDPTLYDKVNHSIMKIKCDTPVNEEFVIPYSRYNEGKDEIFSRAGHFGTDFLLDMFNTTDTKPDPVNAVITKMKSQFGEGATKIDCALNNGNGFRKDLVASKVDASDPTIRYFRTNDFLDYDPFNNGLAIFKVSVTKMNEYLSNIHNRGDGEMQIFKFKDYLVSWEDPSKTYLTTDKVFLVDKTTHAPVAESTNLIVAANSYVYTNHGFDQNGFILDDSSAVPEGTILDKQVKEFLSWSLINLIAYYCTKYKDGVWDLTNAKYDESDYIYAPTV